MAINANEILLKEEVAYVPALTLLIAKNFGIGVQNHSLQVPSNQIMQNTSVIIYVHDPQNYLCIDMESIIVKIQHFLKAKIV